MTETEAKAWAQWVLDTYKDKHVCHSQRGEYVPRYELAQTEDEREPR